MELNILGIARAYVYVIIMKRLLILIISFTLLLHVEVRANPSLDIPSGSNLLFMAQEAVTIFRDFLFIDFVERTLDRETDPLRRENLKRFLSKTLGIEIDSLLNEHRNLYEIFKDFEIYQTYEYHVNLLFEALEAASNLDVQRFEHIKSQIQDPDIVSLFQKIFVEVSLQEEKARALFNFSANRELNLESYLTGALALQGDKRIYYVRVNEIFPEIKKVIAYTLFEELKTKESPLYLKAYEPYFQKEAITDQEFEELVMHFSYVIEREQQIRERDDMLRSFESTNPWATHLGNPVSPGLVVAGNMSALGIAAEISIGVVLATPAVIHLGYLGVTAWARGLLALRKIDIALCGVFAVIYESFTRLDDKSHGIATPGDFTLNTLEHFLSFVFLAGGLKALPATFQKVVPFFTVPLFTTGAIHHYREANYYRMGLSVALALFSAHGVFRVLRPPKPQPQPQQIAPTTSTDGEGEFYRVNYNVNPHPHDSGPVTRYDIYGDAMRALEGSKGQSTTPLQTKISTQTTTHTQTMASVEQEIEVAQVQWGNIELEMEALPETIGETLAPFFVEDPGSKRPHSPKKRVLIGRMEEDGDGNQRLVGASFEDVSDDDLLSYLTNPFYTVIGFYGPSLTSPQSSSPQAKKIGASSSGVAATGLELLEEEEREIRRIQDLYGKEFDEIALAIDQLMIKQACTFMQAAETVAEFLRQGEEAQVPVDTLAQEAFVYEMTGNTEGSKKMATHQIKSRKNNLIAADISVARLERANRWIVEYGRVPRRRSLNLKRSLKDQGKKELTLLKEVFGEGIHGQEMDDEMYHVMLARAKTSKQRKLIEAKREHLLASMISDHGGIDAVLPYLSIEVQNLPIIKARRDSKIAAALVGELIKENGGLSYGPQDRSHSHFPTEPRARELYVLVLRHGFDKLRKHFDTETQEILDENERAQHIQEWGEPLARVNQIMRDTKNWPIPGENAVEWGWIMTQGGYAKVYPYLTKANKRLPLVQRAVDPIGALNQWLSDNERGPRFNEEKRKLEGLTPAERLERSHYSYVMEQGIMKIYSKLTPQNKQIPWIQRIRERAKARLHEQSHPDIMLHPERLNEIDFWIENHKRVPLKRGEEKFRVLLRELLPDEKGAVMTREIVDKMLAACGSDTERKLVEKVWETNLAYKIKDFGGIEKVYPYLSPNVQALPRVKMWVDEETAIEQIQKWIDDHKGLSFERAALLSSGLSIEEYELALLVRENGGKDYFYRKLTDRKPILKMEAEGVELCNFFMRTYQRIPLNRNKYDGWVLQKVKQQFAPSTLSERYLTLESYEMMLANAHSKEDREIINAVVEKTLKKRIQWAGGMAALFPHLASDVKNLPRIRMWVDQTTAHEEIAKWVVLNQRRPRDEPDSSGVDLTLEEIELATLCRALGGYDKVYISLPADIRDVFSQPLHDRIQLMNQWVIEHGRKPRRLHNAPTLRSLTKKILGIDKKMSVSLDLYAQLKQAAQTREDLEQIELCFENKLGLDIIDRGMGYFLPYLSNEAQAIIQSERQ